jgi:hypothetical protein
MKRVTYILARRDDKHPWRVYRKERWRPSYQIFRLESFEIRETWECSGLSRGVLSVNALVELKRRADGMNERERAAQRLKLATESLEQREKELEPYTGKRLL